MSTPSISVVVPLFDKADCVGRAVRSVLTQTMPNFELLIIDDGSTDDGVCQVKPYTSDARVRIVRQGNAGVGAARNRGLAGARGAIIAFLDADDEWLPTHLEDTVQLARLFPEAGLFGTRFATSSAGNVCVCEALRCEAPVLMDDYLAWAARRRAYIINSSTTSIHRRVLEKVGGFLVNTPIGEDLEYWARVSLSFSLAYHPRCSAIYRTDVQGSAMNVATWSSSYPAVVDMLKTHLSQFPYSAKDSSVREYAAWILLNHAKAGLAAGRAKPVRRILSDSLFKDRKRTRYWLLRLAAAFPPRTATTLFRLYTANWFKEWRTVYHRPCTPSVPTHQGSNLQVTTNK